MDLTHTYRIFYPTVTEYTFISAFHKTFSKIYHILGYKTSLNTYKKTSITSYILLDHNGIKLKINSKRNYRKYKGTQKLNSILYSKK
jgi:hypothetical protein